MIRKNSAARSRAGSEVVRSRPGGFADVMNFSDVFRPRVGGGSAVGGRRHARRARLLPFALPLSLLRPSLPGLASGTRSFELGSVHVHV